MDAKGNMNLDQFQKMMDPRNLPHTIRQFIALGSKEIIEQFLDKADLASDGLDYLACAIHFGHASIVELFLSKGVKTDIAPQSVAPSNVDASWSQNYRKTPFLIQCAQQGSLENFQLIQKTGRQIFEPGHICLSRRRRNAVVSNVVGAAAYYGHPKLVKFLLTKLSVSMNDEVNLPAVESQDTSKFKAGPYQPEFEGFTPLMLAIVSEKPSLDVVKALLAAHANFTFIEKHTGDNIIHLAARYCSSLDILEYLVRSLNQDMLFERNLKGDTPLTICIAQKNQKAVELLQRFQQSYDKSRQKADDLLANLEAEEQRAERERQKRKEKKYKAKLQKIAERDNCTPEEVAQRLAAEKQRREEEELARVKEAQRREQEEEAARQREIEERRKAHEREKQQYKAEQEALRKQQQAERAQRRVQQQQEISRRIREEEKQQQQQEQVNTLSARKPKTAQQERPRLRSVAPTQDEAAEVIDTPEPETQDITTSLPPQKADHQIIGLTGNMALSKLSKRQKKKLISQMNAEEEQEKQLRERILKAKQDQQQEQERARQEALQAQRAEEKRIRQEAQKQAEIVRKEREEAAAKAAAEKAQRREKLQEMKAQQKQAMAQMQPAQAPAKEETVVAAGGGKEAKKQPAKKMYVQKQATENTASQNLPAETPKQPETKKADTKKAEPKQAERVPEVSLKQVTTEKKEFSQKDYERLLREKNQMQRHYDGIVADLQAQLKTEQTKNSSQKQEITKLFDEIAQIRDSVESPVAPASAGNERELQAQLKSVQDQLNTQLAVNKSLTTKVLNFEKQVSDQKRRTQELERKLTQVGSTGLSDNGVSSVQQKLNELKNRVSGLQ